jgi:hypothetical protein
MSFAYWKAVKESFVLLLFFNQWMLTKTVDVDAHANEWPINLAACQ